MRVHGQDRRDAWIPWAFAAAFGMFLLAAVVLAVIAVRSDPGLVAGAPQSIAGAYVVPSGPAPVLDLRVAGRSPAGVAIEARLRGPDGRPAAAEAVAGTLQRATHARDDQPVRFEPTADGAWRVVVTPPGPGAWEVAVQARMGGSTATGSLRL